MKTLYPRIALFSLITFLAGCAALPNLGGLLSELNYSHAEISERLAKRFPFERSLAGLLDVKLLHPRVGFSDGGIANAPMRLSVSFDAEATLALTKKSITGSIGMSGVPEYVGATREIFLRDARVDSLKADGVPDALIAAVTNAASKIAKEALEEKPLYTVQEKDLQRFGLSLRPTNIEVRREGIALKLR